MTLTKVKIEAFNKNDFTGKIGEFELPINPEQFTQSFKVENDRSQAQGAQGNDPKFKYTRPEELKLDFTLDGTGVVPINEQPGAFYRDFLTQLQNFLNVVYTMDGETHRPNFLRLIWGKFSFNNRDGFDCVLSDLQINYTLFAQDGTPLRAKLSATFLSYTELERRLREENRRSPDVTHMRKVMAGDALPLMTYRIYNDPAYYLQVAKANGLVNFRRLATNTDLRFPPLEKTEV
jgi:nucleoid-associated protein YgaU